MYFSEPRTEVSHERSKDEAFLLNKFRTFLKKQDPGVTKLLTKDFIIAAPTTSIKFDYAWQNGTFNLVKPVSFDLKNEVEIHRKALQYYGNFNLLADVITREKFRIDVLTSPPSNPKLNKEYLRAINILRRTTAPNKIITQDEELVQYSEDAARNLREHHQPTDTGLFIKDSI